MQFDHAARTVWLMPPAPSNQPPRSVPAEVLRWRESLLHQPKRAFVDELVAHWADDSPCPPKPAEAWTAKTVEKLAQYLDLNCCRGGADPLPLPDHVPADWPSQRSALLDAVAAEIAEAKRTSRDRATRLGFLIETETPRLFSCDLTEAGASIDPNQLLQYFVLDGEKQRHEVELVSATDALVLVRLADHFAEPATLYCTSDPIFLLEAQTKRLEALADAPTLAHQLASGVVTRTAGGAAVLGLNAQQSAAVTAAHEPGVHLIWGPPGTGKTEVLGRILALAHRDGRTVLLASATNLAIDEALLRAYNRCAPAPVAGELVRLGLPAAQEMQKHAVLPLTAAAATVNAELVQRLRTLEADKTVLERAPELSELRRLNDLLATLAADRVIKAERTRSILAAGEYVATAYAEYPNPPWASTLPAELPIASVWQHLPGLHDDLDDTVDDLLQNEPAYEAAALVADAYDVPVQVVVQATVLAAWSAERLDAHPHLLEKEDTSRQDLPLAAEAAQVTLSLMAAGHTLTATEAAYEQCRVQCAAIHDKLSELTREISAVKAALKETEQRILRTATVVGTTLSKALIDPVLLERKFDMVVVDEASLATLPQLVCVASLASATVLCVGDFMQNGPITQVRDEVHRRWLAVDVFAHCGIAHPGSAASRGAHVLSEQRRFPADVAALVNDCVYSGLLTTHADAPTLAGPAIILVDTSSLGELARVSESLQNGKPWWAAGALTARLLADALAAAGRTDIGYVTPYRNQVLLAEAVLTEQRRAGVVTVATSHRAQGQEYQAVIFDLVQDGMKARWMAQAALTGKGIDGLRVFNVAATRTKGPLYVIGDRNAIRVARSGALASLQQMIADGRAHVLPARGLFTATDLAALAEALTGDPGLPTTAASDGSTWLSAVTAPRTTALRPVSVLNAHGFEKHLPELLRSAGRIIIVSPFVRHNRLDKLEPALRALAPRLQVVTKPASEDTQDSGARARLRAMGIRVAQFRGLHEKILVLDDSAWMGSFNVLSWGGGTSELMADHGRTAKQVLQVAGIPDLQPKHFACADCGDAPVTGYSRRVSRQYTICTTCNPA